MNTIEISVVVFTFTISVVLIGCSTLMLVRTNEIETIFLGLIDKKRSCSKKNKIETGKLHRFLNRNFDIIISAIALLILSPYILVLSLLIKFEVGSPVFIRLELANLRSLLLFMVLDKSGDVALKTGSAKLSLIGNFIKKYKLQYLPAFISVLKGDCSIVGLSMTHHCLVTREHQILYNYCKPGIINLYNLLANVDKSIVERYSAFDIDKIYLKNKSILVDFRLLLCAAKYRFS